MCKDNVSVAAPSHVERLTGADRPHFHCDAGLQFEERHQILEQARIDFSCASVCPARKTALQKTAMSANVGFRNEGMSVPTTAA
jgi:hypothetical protein